DGAASDPDGGASDGATSDVVEPPPQTGSLRWLKTVSGPPSSILLFTAGAIDAQGNVLVTGIAQVVSGSQAIPFGDGKTLNISAANDQESFIARYDANGVCQWVTLVSGAGDEFIFR